MFTRMAMGVLTIIIIAGAISSLILGVKVGKSTDNFGLGFLITIVGWVVTMLSSCVLGVIVELANNVMDCKQIMQQIADKMNRANLPCAEESGSNGNSGGKSADPRDLLKRNDEFWKCPECGTQNEKFRYSCQRCGALSRAGLVQQVNSNANSNANAVQKYWFCSKCGEQNAPEVRFCVHCGQPRLSKPQEK